MSVPATNDFPAGRVTCICRAGWIGEYCTTSKIVCVNLGPVYMRKNTSPARPGAER